MNEYAIPVVDANGDLWWFVSKEARSWTPRVLNCGVLYLVAKKWVLRPEMADLSGEMAEFLNDEKALQWLLCNGYKPPEQLSKLAQSTRL